MTRARDNADGARLDAPIAGPTFTGTVAIPNVANLETAVVANTAKVTNYNQTLADINALDVTELGTVTSGVLEDAVTYRNINQDLATSDSPKFSDVSWDGSGVITPVNVAATSTLASGSTTSLATLNITEEGIYSVFCNLRWGFTNSNSGFMRIFLYSGSEIGNQKMQFELVAVVAGNANLNIHTSWIMNFHNYDQYPYAVILKAYNHGATTRFHQNDTNGYTNFGAIKFARSSITSAGATQIGT